MEERGTILFLFCSNVVSCKEGFHIVTFVLTSLLGNTGTCIDLGQREGPERHCILPRLHRTLGRSQA